MGQVIQSFHHTAVVRLVKDGQSKVGVSFGTTQSYTATVDGQGPNSPMTADLVAPHTPLHKGEEMYHEQSRRCRLPSRHPGGAGLVLPHQCRRQSDDDRGHTVGRPQPIGLCERRALGASGVSARVVLRLALVTLLLLLVQSTVLLSIRIGGIHPDILWLLPITAALLAGPETGALVGFWSGLAFDLVLPTPFGLSALVGCLLGYSIGAATAAVDRRAVWLKPVAAVVGSVAADMLFSVLGAIFGQQQMVQVDYLSLFVIVAVSSALLVLPVSRLMRWALFAEGTRRTLVSAQSTEGGLW